MMKNTFLSKYFDNSKGFLLLTLLAIPQVSPLNIPSQARFRQRLRAQRTTMVPWEEKAKKGRSEESRGGKTRGRRRRMLPPGR